MPALHSVSVAAVIEDDRGRALLIRRRDNSRWEPPGGVLELNEDIFSGLRRETLEETGLEVDPISLTGVYKNMSRGVVALVFLCKPFGGRLTVNDEVTDFKWAMSAEIAAMVDEAFAVRVTDALSHPTTPVVRQHDGVHVID